MDWSDTIVACATPMGEGARSILRVTGPRTVPIVSALLDRSSPELPPSSWTDRRVTPVVLRLCVWNRTVNAWIYTWPQSLSYTGQTTCEVHIPCSGILVSAVEEEIVRGGARPARPGEFTLRAFLAGRIDLAQAEGVLGLIEAEDLDVLAEAIDQRTGGISRPIAELRSELLDLLADLEAGLDFAHEDITFLSHEALTRRLTEASQRLESLQSKLYARRSDPRRPRVVLAGRPNVGKSSLFNAILGVARAITQDKPGTTRDTVEATVGIGGRLVDLVDTAGVEDSQDLIHRQASRHREWELRQADLVLVCVPVNEPSTDSIATDRTTLVVRTKNDLRRDAFDPRGEIHVSVYDRPSLDALAARIAEQLDATESRRGGHPVTTRVFDSLVRSAAALEESSQWSEQSAGEEYVASGVREAIHHLGEIVGAVYTEDLLDRVFSRFCIGK